MADDGLTPLQRQVVAAIERIAEAARPVLDSIRSSGPRLRYMQAIQLQRVLGKAAGPTCPEGFELEPRPWLEMGGRRRDGTHWYTCPCGRIHDEEVSGG